MTSEQTPGRALVTGATGFIGQQLVGQLLQRQWQVTAMVRETSDTRWLEEMGVPRVVADLVQQPEPIVSAVKQCDVVFHLAAETHAVRSEQLVDRNLASTRHVLEAMSRARPAPRLVYVSSLAAVGPSGPDEPLDESAPLQPVSYYGKSKAACEREIRKFAGQLPVSIVRPPIVLGQGDHSGLRMFELIDKTGIHLVPGFRTRRYSLVHVEDLVAGLIAVAERGERVGEEVDSRGVYFCACDEQLSFADLGRAVGRSLGRKRTWIIKIAKPVMWAVCGLNECKGRITGRADYLNFDKFHEAFAGSWLCSAAKLRRDLGFRFEVPLAERLRQTSSWYRQQGWLPSRRWPDGQGRQEADTGRTESFG